MVSLLLLLLVPFSHALGLVVEPRVAPWDVEHNGLTKYQESHQIGYDRGQIDGYFFAGDSVFDLPDTIGLIYQMYPHRPNPNKPPGSRGAILERMVVYVVADKAILVLGIPLEDNILREVRSQRNNDRATRNLDVMQNLLHGPNVLFYLRLYHQPAKAAPAKKLIEVLSYIKRYGGKIQSAGVVGFQGAIRFSSPVAYDALGLCLLKELGVYPTPWRAEGTSRMTEAFLAWTGHWQRRVLRLSIGSEVIFAWEEGSQPYYPPSWSSASRFNQLTAKEEANKYTAQEATNAAEELVECAMEVDEDEIENGQIVDEDNNNNTPSDPPGLQKIFQIKTGKNKGGCDAHQGDLRAWFSEAKEIAKAGLQAFSDASNGNKIAQETLKQFLGIDSSTPASDLEDTKMRLLDVYDFLTGELNLDIGRPWLFCGSTWLEQKKRDDPSLTSSGDVKHTSQGNPLQIQNDPLYRDELWIKMEGKDVPSSWVPYWSSDLGTYIFDLDYAGKGYCTFTGNLATTPVSPPIVNLCPKSFTSTQMAQKLGGRRGNSARLQDLIPRSGTLFHELFHLVYGLYETPDASYSLHTLLNALKSPNGVPKSLSLDEPDNTDQHYENVSKLTNLELVRENPETWVYFCVSYWYTLNQNVYFPNGKTGVSSG